MSGYRPAVCAFKVTLEEDLTWVGDVELAVVLGDSLEVSAGTGCGLCAGQAASVSADGVVRATNTTVGVSIDFKLLCNTFEFFP